MVVEARGGELVADAEWVWLALPRPGGGFDDDAVYICTELSYYVVVVSHNLTCSRRVPMPSSSSAMAEEKKKEHRHKT